MLDYPLKCSPRYGYGKPPHQQLFAILEARRNEYAKRLSAFCKLKGSLSQIPAESTPEAIEPCWGPQRYFSSLDAVALYGVLVEFRPKRFVEVGSGCVSRTHCLSTTVRNCTRDEGGPFEAGSQVQVSSHRKRLSSRAMVVLCQEGART